MNDDPANFYARLASADAAEARRQKPQAPKPVSTTLQALKDKATAAELTLIETVEAAVQENAFKTARHMVRDAASTYIMRNQLHQYGNPAEWCAGFNKALDAVSPETPK